LAALREGRGGAVSGVQPRRGGSSAAARRRTLLFA